MALAQNGCGKFQPTNAPTAIQNSVSNMMFLLSYNAGNDNAGPAGLPVVGEVGVGVLNAGATLAELLPNGALPNPKP